MPKTNVFSFHPACLLFPELADEELQELAADIADRSQIRLSKQSLVYFPTANDDCRAKEN